MAFLSSLDIASENIANMDTTRTEGGGAYKRKLVSFQSYETRSFQDVLKSARDGRGIASRKAGVRVSAITEDDREMQKVYNPEHPDANVDVLKETVDSMAAYRSYEANVTALNAMKLMAQKALEIGR